MNKSKVIPTIKKWLLMISMSLGIGGYFFILTLDLGKETNHQIATVITDMLPYLLFVMLFLEFSKIEPRDLFPKKWLWMTFAFQIVMAFITIAIQKYGCMPQWTTAMWNVLCITIIGIPWGKMHFRLAKLALSPFGMEVV